MWPNARISVMGGEQAASVLATVRSDQVAAARSEEHTSELPSPALREKVASVSEPDEGEARKRHWASQAARPSPSQR